MIRKKTNPSKIPPVPMVKPADPEEPFLPEEDPDIIPDEDPFEIPQHEEPPPGEGP